MSIKTKLLFSCCLLSFTLTAQSDAYKTTPAGTKYKITRSALPEPGSFVYFHAEMRTQRDSVLFSTRDRDEETPPVISVPDPGETLEKIGPVEDVLRCMRVGERAKIVVDTKEFPTKPPGIGDDTIVYYEVEVIEIISEEEFVKREVAANQEKEERIKLVQSRTEERKAFHQGISEKYRNGNLENIVTTEFGLKYVIHEEGKGAKPESGEQVSVNYIGSLVPGGEPFDLSFQRGEPIKFTVGIGRVITGWDKGLQLLPRGTKATFFIPAALGYGEAGTPDGSIPPNTEITFYVELE